MDDRSGKQTYHLNENTVVSLQLVVVLLGFAVWLIRLGDRVDQHDKDLAEISITQRQCSDTMIGLEQRLYRTESRLKMQHDR